MTIKSIKSSIKNFLFLSVSERYKRDFNIYIDRINVSRAKTTAAVFIVSEIMLIIVSLAIKKQEFFKAPDIYYGAMYFLLILVMSAYLTVFIKLEKNVTERGTSIQVVGVSFTCFILLWCAIISLLDQLSYGQVIVYVVAIMSVAVVPLFKPITSFLMYLIPHVLFMVLLPYYQMSGVILLGNYVNSSLFLIISWAISSMRYKSHIKHFNDGNIIQQKNHELERLIKELEEVNQKLEKLSQTDSLTGMFNRFMFDKKIKSEWDRCKRYFTPLSLIMIDIDFFKAFNDNYGHQAGDDCIRKVAEVLLACARRSSDVVARYGGEEFAIILPYMEKENALEIAEQMRRGVEELAIQHPYSSVSEYLTISSGVCTVIPSDKSSIEEFIRVTDKALYGAKQKNRNNVVVA